MPRETAPIVEERVAQPSERAEEWGTGDFGVKIRHLRKERGLSLKDLSGMSGLSIALISQVERGLNTPSMRSIRLLAAALGVTVQSLFSEVEEVPDSATDVVVHSANRRVLNLGRIGTFMELLTPKGFQELQVFHSYIDPGAGSGPEYDSHAGSECGVILAGRLDLWLGERKMRLVAGDSFSFQSEVPHRYENPGKTMTQVIWIVTPPIY